jgi:GSCFA family.
MIDYCTYLDIPKSVFDISYKNQLMFIGSCFADNIGEKMHEHKFKVDVNPFGVLYNPFSVASACKYLLKPDSFVEEDLFNFNGMYHSFMHHGKFSDSIVEGCLSKINESLKCAAENFRELSYLVITFGTAYVYRLKKDEKGIPIESGYPERLIGQVVANCHKLPATKFDRELLTVDMIVNEWSALIENMLQVNPSLKLIFTVSPIRHLKDGAHLNQISKSTLLLAEQQLIDKYPEQISYFPAYELMMDELRDYRFYADDMLHPSKIAISYIWERFCDTYMEKEEKEVMKELEGVNRALNHRPLNSSSDAYKHFLMQTMLKIKLIKEKYPYLCLSEEEKELASKQQN